MASCSGQRGRAKRRSPGGFLYETRCACSTMMGHLFGEPAEIVCRGRATVYGQLDDFSRLFTFASGASAVLATSAHTTWLFPFERVEVYRAHAMAATEEMERITSSTGVRMASETLDFAQQPLEERSGFVDEDARFVAAALGDGRPAVGADEALATTELAERCYAAAAAALRGTRAGCRERKEFVSLLRIPQIRGIALQNSHKNHADPLTGAVTRS